MYVWHNILLQIEFSNDNSGLWQSSKYIVNIQHSQWYRLLRSSKFAKKYGSQILFECFAKKPTTCWGAHPYRKAHGHKYMSPSVFKIAVTHKLYLVAVARLTADCKGSDWAIVCFESFDIYLFSDRVFSLWLSSQTFFTRAFLICNNLGLAHLSQTIYYRSPTIFYWIVLLQYKRKCRLYIFQSFLRSGTIKSAVTEWFVL